MPWNMPVEREAGSIEGEDIKMPISLIQGITFRLFSEWLKPYVLFRPLYLKILLLTWFEGFQWNKKTGKIMKLLLLLFDK